MSSCDGIRLSRVQPNADAQRTICTNTLCGFGNFCFGRSSRLLSVGVNQSSTCNLQIGVMVSAIYEYRTIDLE